MSPPPEEDGRGFRVRVVMMLVLGSSLALFAALFAPWVRFKYDHATLCTMNAAVCDLHVDYGLTSLCVKVPSEPVVCGATEKQFEGKLMHPKAAQVAVEVLQDCKVPRMLLGLAILLHAPAMLALLITLVVIHVKPDARGFLSVGLRTCSVCSGLAFCVNTAALITILAWLVPRAHDFLWLEVGHRFGRPALATATVHGRPFGAPVAGVFAALWDAAAACLTWHVGPIPTMRRHILGQAELTLPARDAVGAGRSAGAKDFLGAYVAVPTSEGAPIEAPGQIGDGQRGKPRAGGVLGRYRQHPSWL